jgi:hypothetical protein
VTASAKERAAATEANRAATALRAPAARFAPSWNASVLAGLDGDRDALPTLVARLDELAEREDADPDGSAARPGRRRGRRARSRAGRPDRRSA